MAESLELIAQPVKHRLEEYEVFFRKNLETDVPLLQEIIDYLLLQKGKQLRPLIIFLSADMNGEINPLTYLTATAIEMLHTATLVHDDVVDDADERRGMKSVNAIWHSKAAVLVGDYLLSQALMLVTHNHAFDLLEMMTLPIRYMSEGELLQIQKSFVLDTTQEVYFEIINKKTAALFAACAATGAKSAGATDETVRKMHKMGELMGMAFQIRDDIFDYQKTDLIGKLTGNDVIERKITLPLIYALKQVNADEQKRVLDLVKNAADNKQNVELVRDFVITHKGLEYALEIANQFRNEAIAVLNGFESSPAHKSLIELANYITVRNK